MKDAREPSSTEPPAGVVLHDDAAFDRHLPRYARMRSRQYWTPVRVATHVAEIFRTRRVRRVLDVGCGPGKFCIVAGSRDPGLEVHGIDRRRRLIEVGQELARRFSADNVRLFVGDATRASWGLYDGFYFFNPFAENAFERHDRFDDEIDLSTVRFIRELRQVERQLALAPRGTVVVTYHGLGGPIPGTYQLVADENLGTGRIRTWVQGQRSVEGSVWLESATSVVLVSHARMRAMFASLLAEPPEEPPAYWLD